MLIYDLIIVGAGITGLSAARYLSKHNPEIKFKILEARDRVGGRTLNHTVSLPLSSENDSGCLTAIVDIGGQWIGPTQTNIRELIQELEANNEGLSLIEQTWATRKDKYAGQPGLYEALRVKSLTIEEEQEVIEMNNRLDRMALEIPSIQEPFKDCAMAKEWDQISVGEYLEKNVKQKNSLQELFLEILTLTGILRFI
jgi:monoamine oxidase